MNIDAMRWIDRYVGVPLCAIATPLVRLWHRAFAKTPGSPPRVLFIEMSEMGSTILAAPAMQKARERLGAELFFVIFRKNVGSLEMLGMISQNNVFTIRDESLFHLTWDTAAFLFWARHKGIDTVIDLELFSRYTAMLAGFSGGSRRVGFYGFHQQGLYRGEMLTHRVAYNPHIHVAKNFIALVDSLLVPEPTQPYSKTLIGDEQIKAPDIKPSEAARAAMLTRIRDATGFDPKLQRLLLINPNASEMLPHRRWMPDRYADLIKRVLASYADVIVVITGAPDESADAEALASGCGPRCFSFAGKTAIAELPVLYSHAVAMITNDSGPAHFASAARLPTIVLFGPETPKLYQPLGVSQAIYAGLACSPCVNAQNQRKTACTDKACMRALRVDQVYAALTVLLARRIGSDSVFVP